MITYSVVAGIQRIHYSLQNQTSRNCEGLISACFYEIDEMSGLTESECTAVF